MERLCKQAQEHSTLDHLLKNIAPSQHCEHVAKLSLSEVAPRLADSGHHAWFKRIHPLSLVHKTVLLLFRAGRRCIALLVQESLANHVRNRAHPGSSPIAVWLLRLDLAEVGRVVVVGAALRAGRRLTGLAARLGAGRRHSRCSLPLLCCEQLQNNTLQLLEHMWL